MVQPLTKGSPDGGVYIRPQRVEAEIAAVLGQDLATIRHQLAVTARESKDFLSSECLVHLVRLSLREDNDPRASAALAVLMSRCEATLKAKIPDATLSNAADVREEIVSQFGELFATDGTEENLNDLDFFECKFNFAFRTFYIDLVRSEIARLKHIAPMPDQSDDIDPETNEERLARVSEAFRAPATQESALFLKDLGKAIDALPPDERKALILCHVLGYDEESDNPNKVTAATRCNCTGRTIRNRLARAAAKLASFKEFP
jgi:hypothetical protein